MEQQSPSLSSDSESENRWIFKPKTPISKPKQTKQNIDKMNEDDVSKREEQDLEIVQLEIYIKCVRLIANQAKLVLESYKLSNC